MTKNELELSPLRSVDDFLLGSARFQLPNYKDLEKWGNRVVQNLLYYQTNYFLLAIFMIVLFTLMHPLKMLLGALSVVIMSGLFYYSVNASSSATRFKKKHPLVSVSIVIAGACLVVYLLGSFIVFLCGILSPISAIFIHASLRLRNIKNKLSSIERAVSGKTPMGVLLESLEGCVCVAGIRCHLLYFFRTVGQTVSGEFTMSWKQNTAVLRLHYLTNKAGGGFYWECCHCFISSCLNCLQRFGHCPAYQQQEEKGTLHLHHFASQNRQGLSGIY